MTRKVRTERRQLRVAAVVPAYNEAAAIADTIASLRRQTQRPELIVVVPNNCTDHTAEAATRAGAYVIEFPGHNPDKKAGAINYALDRLEPYLGGVRSSRLHLTINGKPLNRGRH
ncbi:glycosyltransferase [Paractinoplanes durhamensis]|uniref:glycosyltransferase n=1 Tax=Paractinoplanes durhamensis TaxID=113563 RepID=UPI0019440FE0|nr:glycosyltransferase [Actinoplanes durhamensis]